MPITGTLGGIKVPNDTSAVGGTSPSARFLCSGSLSVPSGTPTIVPLSVTDWNSAGVTLNADGSLSFPTAAVGKYYVTGWAQFSGASVPVSAQLLTSVGDTLDTVSEMANRASTGNANLLQTGQPVGMHIFNIGDGVALQVTQYSGSTKTLSSASLSVVKIASVTPVAYPPATVLVIAGPGGDTQNITIWASSNGVYYSQIGNPSQYIVVGYAGNGRALILPGTLRYRNWYLRYTGSLGGLGYWGGITGGKTCLWNLPGATNYVGNGQPASGSVGDFYVTDFNDATGVCVTAGTPGVWVSGTDQWVSQPLTLTQYGTNTVSMYGTTFDPGGWGASAGVFGAGTFDLHYSVQVPHT